MPPSSFDSIAAFNNKSRQYEAQRPPYPTEIVDAINSAIPPQSVIADIGAGTGYLAIPLAVRGHTLHCIDPNEDFRETCAAKAAKQLQLKVFVKEGEGKNTPMPDNSVDAILLGNVAHWLVKDKDTCIREFGRILKPGGKVICAFNVSSMKSPWMEELIQLGERADPTFDGKAQRQLAEDPHSMAEAFIKHNVDLLAANDCHYVKPLDKTGFMNLVSSLSFYKPSMQKDVEKLFDTYSKDGHIDAAFHACLYQGPLIALWQDVLENRQPRVKS